MCDVPHRVGLVPTGNFTAYERMDLSYIISDIINPDLKGFLTLILGACLQFSKVMTTFATISTTSTTPPTGASAFSVCCYL